jgi:hypothetical protein
MARLFRYWLPGGTEGFHLTWRETSACLQKTKTGQRNNLAMCCSGQAILICYRPFIGCREGPSASIQCGARRLGASKTGQLFLGAVGEGKIRPIPKFLFRMLRARIRGDALNTTRNCIWARQFRGLQRDSNSTPPYLYLRTGREYTRTYQCYLLNRRTPTRCFPVS